MAIIKEDTNYCSTQVMTSPSFFNLSRINRTKHLLFFSFWLFVWFLAAGLVYFTSRWVDAWEIDDTWKAAFSVLLSLSLIFIYCLSLVKIALLKVRRVHDFNCTGWSVLLLFIPVIGLIWGIAIFLIPGTEGENRYGPKP